MATSPKPKKEPSEGQDDTSGMLTGCILALVIGAALLFAFRFLYTHTPLGRLIRDMF